MAPIKSFACSFENCDSVFTKASELKKHEVAHTNPEKIFRCPECPFFSLQKKNLKIHSGTHTGEKRLHCPHSVTCLDSSNAGSPAQPSTVQCSFKTNDPAALTRHRKNYHAYIPTRRGRGPRGANPRSVAGPATPLPAASSSAGAVERRASLVPTDLNGSSSESAPPSPESPRSTTTLSWTGDVDAYEGETTDVESSAETSGYSSECSEVTLVAPEEYMPVDPNYDLEGDALFPGDSMPSDMLDLPDFEMYVLGQDATQTTGREGCLCPEWMVEAGIEGWDESVLEAHRDYYALSA